MTTLLEPAVFTTKAKKETRSHGVLAAGRKLKQEELLRQEQVQVWQAKQAEQRRQEQADRVDTFYKHWTTADKVRLLKAAGRTASLEQVATWLELDEQRVPKASAPVVQLLGGIRAGDIATYKIEGRVVSTMQEVREVNAAGDVLTDKDGWLPAGTFTVHRPMPASEREASPKDGIIWAAGRSWFFQGHAPAKENYEPTERQLRNGTMRARREVARVERDNKAAVASTPPLFYEQPVARVPRYSTAEGANEHLVSMRNDFVARRRQLRAQQIHKLRARLAAYPAAELERLHTLWHKRQWACGLEYLADFLTQEARKQNIAAIKPIMLQLKAALQELQLAA